MVGTEKEPVCAVRAVLGTVETKTRWKVLKVAKSWVKDQLRPSIEEKSWLMKKDEKS